DDAIYRLTGCDAGECGGDVISRDWLHEGRCQADRVALGALVGYSADELEELRRTENCVGHGRGLYQFLLGNLCAQVTTVGQAVGPGRPTEQRGALHLQPLLQKEGCGLRFRRTSILLRPQR